MMHYKGKRQEPNLFDLAIILWLLILSIVLTVSINSREEEVKETEVKVKEVIMPELDVEPYKEAYDQVAIDPEWNWDFAYVCRVVGAECRGEPVEGIMAVCQCIYNTSVARFMTPEEVVKEEGQYTDPMPNEFYDGGETVVECMLRVFACHETVTDEPIRFFCTPAKNGFHRVGYEYVMTIGNHEFYKAKE